MASKWTKIEEVILRDNFSIAKWNELLKKLPGKTEDQIIKKAYKLGIKREKEILNIYYDDERKAWIEESVNYHHMKIKQILVFPAPKGMNYEDVKGILSEKVSRVFSEMFVIPSYKEFLLKLRIGHSEDLYSIFFDMEKEMFGTSDENERVNIFDKYREDLLKAAIETIEKKKGHESAKLKENKKKGR